MRHVDLPLQKKIEKLGLKEEWRQVAGWAEQTQITGGLEAIVATLEEAEWARIEDCGRRAYVAKIAGRTKDDKAGIPAEPGLVAQAAKVCAELVAIINRTGLDLLVPTELERKGGWNPKRNTAIQNRALWRYDDRLARAGEFLLAAQRILAEPPSYGGSVQDALTSRAELAPGGRPRQRFHRTVVESRLTKQLLAIAPEGVTSAAAKRLAIRLLSNLQP